MHASSPPLPSFGSQIWIGNRVVPMPEVRPGDRIIGVASLGELLVISAEAQAEAEAAVREAQAAFAELSRASSAQIDQFFGAFAARLENPEVWTRIEAANARDVAEAKAAGRQVGRLQITEAMRRAMIEGLRGWQMAKSRVGQVLERREEEDFVLERRCAPLGVIAFVFEGRPNVFADGAGVLRNHNTAVMRIGRDAQGTAEAIESDALQPALREAGLPAAAVRLVRCRERAAGQALFTQAGVRLAVARGSGPAVALLGAIAEQHGIAASLHGTGGAWLYVDESASPETLANVLRSSLDRKVCNTLNTLVLDEALPAALLETCRELLRSLNAKVHTSRGAARLFEEGIAQEEEDLGREWEWEGQPELSVLFAGDMEEACALFNRYSPHFVASILTQKRERFETFYERVDAPYVGWGFTRWVDGQWAWQRPELGLTNWERGRLLGRSGILSGDDIVSVRDVFIDKSGRGIQRR